MVCASPCGFVRGGCARCASVLAVLFGAFALDVRPFLRFCRGSGLRLARVRPYGFVAAFGLGSRLSFFLCQEKRDGLRYAPFLFRRVEIAIHALSRRWRGYLPWRVHFGFVRFFMAISTGLPGCGGRGYWAGGAAFVRFCVNISALPCFPRGVRWGLRAPKPAPKSHWLSGLSSFGS